MRIFGSLAALGLVPAFALALAPGCSGGATKAAAPEAAQAQATKAAAVGTPAPDAQLTSASGGKLALADTLHRHAQAIVVFYRGFW